MSIWDAMVIADQKKFYKEQEFKEKEKRRMLAEMEAYNKNSSLKMKELN